MTQVAVHLRELAERIGPRPTTTDTEAEAADYIQHQFDLRGLEVDRQDFNAPRTYSWAYVVYHALTIGAAVLAGFFAWPAFVFAALVAVVMTLDLDTRWGLSNLLPKGPTQNIIGRKPADARRGEVVRKVVIVAHYDSARSSLAFHPSMAKNFNTTFGLMKWLTWAVAVLTFLVATGFGFIGDLAPWPWYLTMAASAYLIVPLVINVHRELFMPFVDGANDNASGVAAMLGILERAVPEEKAPTDTRAMRAIADAEGSGWAEAGWGDAGWEEVGTDADTQPHAVIVVPHAPEPHAEPTPATDGVVEGGHFAYSPAGPLDDSFAGAFDSDLGGEPSGATDDDAGWEEAAVHQDQGSFDVAQDAVAQAPVADEDVSVVTDPDIVEADEPDEAPASEGRRRGLFRRRGRDESPGDWLGIDGDFDVRDEGRRIGSWDQFEDDVGSKGGMAGLGEIDDPGFAASEAARIRHQVTHGLDRGLSEKEIWFVATGAEETGTWGMRAFLDAYGEELKNAAIINLDNVSAGTLSWVTREGMARKYTSDRRMMSAAKRAARENEWRIKGVEYRGLSTDATPALARGFRAMSIMAFDINGRLPHWHWKTDTVENSSIANIELAVDFVVEIVREI